MVATNGVELAVTEAGSGYPVVLCHGFPELAFSWRHQLPALAAAGLWALAPDLRGYGGSTKPEATEEYGLPRLVADVVGLLDTFEIEQAALVGHDWGSIIAWTTALLHPDRVARVVSLNVPYRGRAAGFPSINAIREDHAERFGYVLMFQEPGVAEAWFASDPAARLRTFFDAAAGDGPFLTNEEFEVYASSFAAGGLFGPVSYYRNIDANIAATADLIDSPITQPALMIGAGRDPVLPTSLIEGMDAWVPDLRVEIIEESGHWTQQEQPSRVNDLLVSFLGDLA